jgi:hypothetical protein
MVFAINKADINGAINGTFMAINGRFPYFNQLQGALFIPDATPVRPRGMGGGCGCMRYTHRMHDGTAVDEPKSTQKTHKTRTAPAVQRANLSLNRHENDHEFRQVKVTRLFTVYRQLPSAR